MLRTERIREDNLEYAIQIQEELFPHESGRINFEESVYGITDFEYYLLYLEKDCVGVIGIYSNAIDPQSAWLGWFGIREPYRRRKLGSEAIGFYEEMAKAKGYRFARLYTDEFDNDAAIEFYRSNGYTSEQYSNPEDPICYQYRMLIFSKSLTSDPLVPWNSRNMGLTEQIEKQRKIERERNQNSQ